MRNSGNKQQQWRGNKEDNEQNIQENNLNIAKAIIKERNLNFSLLWLSPHLAFYWHKFKFIKQ